MKTLSTFPKRFFKIATSFAFSIILCHSAQAQYLETFPTANKGYLLNCVNDVTAISWFLTPWDPTGSCQISPPNPTTDLRDPQDYFQTTAAGVLESIDLDQEVCWESPLMNISAAGTVSLSVDLSWVGFDTDVQAGGCIGDYIRVQYSINGGAYTMVPNQVGGDPCATVAYAFSGPPGPFNSSANITQGGITGNTLKIRVCVFTNANAEMVTIDNVSVPQAGVTTGCAAPVLSTVVTQVGCSNPASGAINLTVTGGTPGYTYDWSNDGPENPDNDTQDLSNLTTGTYTVTVTDAANCTATTSATVTNAPPLSLSTQVLGASCAANVDGEIDLIVSGGVPGYTYDWSNDGPESPDNDTQDLIGVGVGSYTATVTDASGCTASTSATVGVLPTAAYNEQFNIPNKGYLANYVDDFSAVNWTISSWSPQPPASFGRDNDDFFRTSGGVLNGEDFDEELCWTSPLIDITGATQFTCFLGWVGFDPEDYITVKYSINGGAFQAVPNLVGGGAGTIQYNTLDNSNSGNIVTPVSGTTLQIQICAYTNSNNENITIDNVSVPGSTPYCPGPIISLIPTHILCNGGSTGNIQVTATSGTPPYNVSWNGPSSGNPAGTEIASSGGSYNIANLTSGTYMVTVTDASALTATTTITLTQPPALILTTVVTNVTCNGGSNGAIDLTVSGGTGGYTYDWSNDGAETPDNDPQDLGSLVAGTYTVTVTDANGCTATTSATVTSPPAGSVLYVNDDASGANDGSSWTNAFTSLQSAIALTNACAGYTEIWVAAGTYKPTTGSDRTISFVLKNNLAIYGGFPNTGNPTFSNRNWGTNITILSGDIGAGGNADNSYNVVKGSGTNSTAILDGFTVTGGNANASPPAFYTSAGRNGGGMFNSGASSPTVRNCYFTGNAASLKGGGMFNSNTNCAPTVTNCAFTNNTAGYGGGGMANWETRSGAFPVITNCTFYGNSGNQGGGMLVDSAKAQVINSIFWGNINSGIVVEPISGGNDLTITNSIVQGGCPAFSACTSILNVDPLFVNAPGGNVHIQQCSPAEDAGTATGAPTTDYDGDVRPFRNGIDIGYDEYIGIPCCTFTLPANGSATVACPAQITQPTPPNVTVNSCNNPVTMTGPVISATPTCEGTKTYTWTYSDGLTTLDWVFTYTIEREDFTVPANGAATVACPAMAIQPNRPFVGDNCNLLLNPTGPVITESPNPVTCEGTKTYTWTYTDCEGNSHPWSFVYTIERNDFTIGTADGAATVACLALATAPTPPAVTSNCGETLTPTGPTITNNPNPLTCEGTRTYTYTYTDCEGNSHPWNFVYTIERNDFTVPADGAATVACLALATAPTPPTVTSNCGETLTPTGPTITNNPNPLTCEGTRTYTYTYTDCEGNSHPWSFVYTIERNDFTVPANSSATVACLAQATAPTLPVVLSNCGETITPTGPTIVDNPNPLTCEGTRTYTYTYTDCEGNSHPWTFTYTIERNDFTVPANGSTTVACLSQAIAPATPVVLSNCGETITPTGPAIVDNPNPLTCEGTRTYTYTYTDCEGNSHPWSFTYTIERNDFTVPANGSATVACLSQATTPTLPSVQSNCGEILTPTGPVITDNPNPLTCEGTRTYAYTYTDCEGNSHPWLFIYIIERNDFTVPANGSATVACPALATQPTPPVVLSNCGETLTPVGPTIVNNPNPVVCAGTRTYTWAYTDCEGNTHNWSFVYNIVPVPFTVPANSSATVACPALATQPTPPTVQDNCGNPTTPTGPVIVNSPNPITCEGTRTYTWTYTDCGGNMVPWSFIYTIERNDFTVPANGAATVACPALATQPTPPAVQSNCGEALTPTGPVIVNNPNPIACEGTRTYTWTFTDCEGNTHPWSFVYTIERSPFTIPTPNGAATVACPALATPPTPPTVLSDCGEVLPTPVPVITNNPNPIACEGTRTYAYTYTDCEGNTATWSFVYTIERNPFTIPTSNGAATVACPAMAIPPTPPTVLSDCGEVLPTPVPVITNNPNPISCEGTRTYAYTYTDCEGNTATWSFVYTIERNPFTIPTPNGAATVACPALATPPTPPTVLSDCGEVLPTPVPVITNNPNPIACEGTRTYAYTYTDCEGNTATWSFVYTIERNPFTIPTPNGAATVACPALATQPTPPVVTSNCGEVLTPTGPTVTNNPNPLTCEGTRTYAWVYTDCEGNTATWSFVYTIERQPFGVPANGGVTVACPDQTDAQPVPPVVTSNCGEVLTPVVTSTAKPGCEGNRNWNFTYTDCEGNTATWTFIYTVEYSDFSIPPSEDYQVECPIGAVQPTPPVVHDNCGKLLNPIGPTITNTNNTNGCASSRQFAWKYIDCEGNAHVWSVTYHFQYTSDFFVYPDQVDYVGCLDFAQAPVPPTIWDNCGQEIAVSGPIVTEEISEGGCSGVRTFTFTYTDCGGHSHPWSYTYVADDNEPPVGTCPTGNGSADSPGVDELGLDCIEEVPCPTDYDFSAKIQQLLAAGHFYDLCSADLVVTLDSWSALWECTDPDGNGQYTFGRTFYFSIADQCGNEFPDLCSVTYSGSCQPMVTFPQSTWGLEDETSNIDLGIIQHLLDAYGPLKIGGTASSLTLTQAQCVADLLPALGGPAQLADCHQVNCVGCNPAAPAGMKNLLAANAIALQLSMRYSVEYNGANMAGMLAQGLGCLQLDPSIVKCNPTCVLHLFDQQGMEHIYPYTLGGLIDLTNYFLGGNVTLSDGQSGVYATALNNALIAVTNHWSGQPSPIGCDPNPGVMGQTPSDYVSKSLSKTSLPSTAGVTFSLAPNPASQEVSVKLFGMDEEAASTLEVRNLFGQIVLHSDLGTVAHIDERIDLGRFAPGIYIVSLKVGGQRFEKKLVVSKG